MTDRAAIRAILERDRVWSLYALGDLDAAHFSHCRWIAAGSGLVMLYQEFTPPVFFFIGKVEEARQALTDLDAPEVYLHVRPEVVEAVGEHYRVEQRTEMWRMALDPAEFRPERRGPSQRLGPGDLAEVEQLYADGKDAGEAPYFFFPSMLETGVFSGIREAGVLVAVAGTHLVNREEGVAAIGNIYTRRDRRGTGLAGAVTSAVAEQLRQMGISTIALNVKQDNPGARRVYERLGFRLYCDFIEGVARR